MRRMGMLLAACALAACGAADQDAPAPAVADSATGDTAYAFRPHETQPGVVDSIVITRGGRVVQVIRPSENHVPPETGIERISRVDLDFDGNADLALVTELGMANSRSEYWRLDPRTGRFESAGVYATLQPDSAARELTSHNRGGHAGRLWTASRWRWVDGALVESRREEQDWLEDAQRYVRIVRERRGGTLAETSRDTLDDAEIRPGPSWMEP